MAESMDEFKEKLAALAAALQQVQPIIDDYIEHRVAYEAYDKDLQAIDEGHLLPFPVHPKYDVNPDWSSEFDYFDDERLREDDEAAWKRGDEARKNAEFKKLLEFKDDID